MIAALVGVALLASGVTGADGIATRAEASRAAMRHAAPAPINDEAGPWTVEDTHLALARYGSARAECIVRVESQYQPYAVGDHGTSFGVAQWHRGGLLEWYFAQGYTDPFDPYQSVRGLQQALNAGMAHHWSAVTRRGC